LRAGGGKSRDAIREERFITKPGQRRSGHGAGAADHVHPLRPDRGVGLEKGRKGVAHTGDKKPDRRAGDDAAVDEDQFGVAFEVDNLFEDAVIGVNDRKRAAGRIARRRRGTAGDRQALLGGDRAGRVEGLAPSDADDHGGADLLGGVLPPGNFRDRAFAAKIDDDMLQSAVRGRWRARSLRVVGGLTGWRGSSPFPTGPAASIPRAGRPWRRVPAHSGPDNKKPEASRAISDMISTEREVYTIRKPKRPGDFRRSGPGALAWRGA